MIQSQNQIVERRHTYLLVLLWLIVTAYNLFKPYHIDDTAYIEIARWISGHPLHPMQGLLNWQGIDEPIYRTNQPHLYFYLMAIWSKLFGFSEPALHSLQALSALACIYLFHKFALFFANEIAVWLTALLVLGPAFIVEQNMMVDVPLLAIWLAFFFVLVCGVRNSNQTARYVIAASACSAGILIKYSSLALFPILCFSLLIERRKKEAWTLLLPVAVLILWSVFNYLDYGSIHIATRPVSQNKESFHTLNALVDWIVTLGGITPIGLIGFVQSRSELKRWQRSIYLVLGFSFAALILAVAKRWLSDFWSDRLLCIIFAANGCATFACIVPALMNLNVSRLWKSEIAEDEAPWLYLGLWAVTTSVFYLFFSPFVAARHVLLIMPPVLLLAGSRWTKTLSVYSQSFALFLTAIVSTGLCISDWNFAAFYKFEAERVMSLLPQKGVVWTNGHWGWQWYATRAGMREIDVRNSPLQPSDYLVTTPLIDHNELKFSVPMHLIRTDAENGSIVDLFCTGRLSRLYSASTRFGPWSLSRACQDRVDVFQIDGQSSFSKSFLKKSQK